MSEEYNEYLTQHIKGVKKAAQYLIDNFSEAEIFFGINIEEFKTIVSNHDKSKYGYDEYGSYDSYFYGQNNGESYDDAFNRAWLHHIHCNPHHWQHWLLINDDGELGDYTKIIPIEMPKVYVLEMISDWWSFSWRSGNLNEVFSWYDDNKNSIILHDNTRNYVELVLSCIEYSLGN